MKIIINADDFGLDEIRTKTIEDYINRGLISSATIMANGECLEEAFRFAKEHPEISFGIHLCLTEYGSITKSAVFKKYGITDDNGIFVKKAILKIKKLPRDLEVAVKEELCAQIKKIQDSGLTISHADSHHHVHTYPQIYKIVIDVLKEYKLRKVRIAAEFPLLRKIRRFNRWVKFCKIQHSLKKKFVTTEYFMSLGDYKAATYKDSGHHNQKYVDEMQLIEDGLFDNIKLSTYYEL